MKNVLFFAFCVFFTALVQTAAQFSRTDNIVETRVSQLRQLTEPLYRKPTKDELKSLEANDVLKIKYADFLKKRDTGMTKLISDQDCSENTKVISAKAGCLAYTLPGAGSSFSFRTETYRIPRLADITFTQNSFQATGVRLHGIFVNLGNIAPETVTLETKGMKFLRDFKPETDFDEGKRVDRELSEGIKQDGFLYRRALYIAENSTFALRSVAYAGKYLRAVEDITYNELDFDKRKDVIVIFRIVEKDSEGNITILWKKLAEKDSPVLKKEAQAMQP